MNIQTNDQKTYRIGISGSYGGLNLGDEAILSSIIGQLRNSLSVEITVFSHDPEDTLARHQVERAVPVRTLTREEAVAEIEPLDLFVLGGGGILFDDEAELYLREADIAHELGTPVFVYGISAGPLKDRSIRQSVRECLDKASVVTVRERQARKLLEEIGVRRQIEVTADPALLLEPEALPADALIREGIEGHTRLIGISVREPGPAAPDLDQQHYHSLLANAADFMVERFDADIVFVPMERRVLDLQQSHAVMAQMVYANRATVLKGEYTSGQILSMMDHFTFALGMRLHFLIFAALRSVPFVALPYAGKVTGFLDDLDMAMPPVQVVNAGRIIAHIDRSWDNREALKERIENNLPPLLVRAATTHQRLIELLTDRQEIDASPIAKDEPIT
jgi:polysaccharide pyruvyl transferase CsaB